MMKRFINFLKKGLKKQRDISLIDRLETMIEEDQEKSSEELNDCDSDELALVSNVLGLKDLTAADIMIPRADIVAAKADASLEELIDLLSQNNYSQIPIYKNTLDDVIGIVRVRDFLPYIKDSKSFDLKNLLKDVIYVVPSIQLLELLVEIKSSANHMALVVDEFGGVDGLVTLQDVVAEIVGEIQQTRNILPQIYTKADGSYVADAKMLVAECSEILNIDLLEPFSTADHRPDVETLGGLMMLLAERMPTRGEIFKHPSGIEFEIVEADVRCTKRVSFRKPSRGNFHNAE